MICAINKIEHEYPDITNDAFHEFIHSFLISMGITEDFLDELIEVKILNKKNETTSATIN